MLKFSDFYALVIIVCILSGCESGRVVFKTSIPVRSVNNTLWELERMRFKMNIPKGYSKEIIENLDDLEVRYIYPDSSVIYFSDHLKSGSLTNNGNMINIASYPYDHAFKDTVSYQGLSDGKYWREEKITNVVIGYSSVSENKKTEFDKALYSIR
tara:strand:+ start:635 stop:1099 length:465 start_codon:yes stop_codon:yes gene_type:complete